MPEQKQKLNKISSAIFSSIIKSLPGSIYWKDKEGKYLGCNANMLEMAGMKSIIGKTDFDMPWADAAQILRDNDLKVMSLNTALDLEETVVTANGQEIVALTRKTPLLDEQGNSIGIIGTSLNITNRKQQESILRLTQEKIESALENIVTNMPGHVYWKDKNGVYLGCNDLQAKSLGFKNGHEIIGKSDFDLPWGKNKAELFRKNDIHIMETGKTEIIEERAQVGGKDAVVLSHKSPMRNKEGEVIGVLGISIDITDRKKWKHFIYRLCSHSPMYNCEEWIEGSMLSILFKNIKLSSQRISDTLSFLGDESIQRSFFTGYLKLVGGSSHSVIIDATSLPNHINIDFNAWGRSDGKIEKQFRLLCVVDQVSKTPLFYRFLPGNITDVSTLQTTILELKAMGVNNSFVLIDAGYFSESNISDLYKRKIDFLTRLPSGRKIYKEIILNKTKDIERLKNAYTIGHRSFYIKTLKIDLYGNSAHAFVVLDPERKAKEMKELLQKYCNDKSERDEAQDKLEFSACGIMILVSSKAIKISEVLSSYYLRQSVEQIFGFSKSDLGILPIRNHNENTVRGYLFLQFILLIFYIKIREKISANYTVEQTLLILRKLKCKVYDSQIIPAELTKNQKLIFEQTEILVPKFLGI